MALPRWPLLLVAAACAASPAPQPGAPRSRRQQQDAAVAGLRNLTVIGNSPVGGIQWQPAFAPAQLAYNITMPKWTNEITLTPYSAASPPGPITVQTIVRPLRSPPAPNPSPALCCSEPRAVCSRWRAARAASASTSRRTTTC